MVTKTSGGPVILTPALSSPASQTLEHLTVLRVVLESIAVG